MGQDYDGYPCHGPGGADYDGYPAYDPNNPEKKPDKDDGAAQPSDGEKRFHAHRCHKCTLIYLACAAILGACTKDNPFVIEHRHIITFGDKKAQKAAQGLETLLPH